MNTTQIPSSFAINRFNTRSENHNYSSVATVIFLLFVTAAPQSVQATTTATTSANTNGTPMVHPNLGIADSDQETGANGQSSQTSSYMGNSATVFAGGVPLPVLGTQYASASAFAYAAEGMLRASADAGASTADLAYNAAGAISFANAGWGDSLIIDAGNGLLNQSGFITADFNVNGFFDVFVDGTPGNQPQSQASMVHLAVRIMGTGMASNNECGGWAYCVEQRLNSGLLLGGPLVDVNTFVPVISLNIPVIFGREVTLNYALDMYSQADTVTGGDSGSSTAAAGSTDYSHTLTWGGITGAFDANGNRVDIFSTSSASGFDYVQAYAPAIPVPASFWLLGSGLLGLVAVARRKTV